MDEVGEQKIETVLRTDIDEQLVGNGSDKKSVSERVESPHGWASERCKDWILAVGRRDERRGGSRSGSMSGPGRRAFV